MRPMWLGGVARVVLCVMLAYMGIAMAAEKPARSGKEAQTVDTEAISKKLDEILKNQHDILQKLDLMGEELRVIKVRSSI